MEIRVGAFAVGKGVTGGGFAVVSPVVKHLGHLGRNLRELGVKLGEHLHLGYDLNVKVVFKYALGAGEIVIGNLVPLAVEGEHHGVFGV